MRRLTLLLIVMIFRLSADAQQKMAEDDNVAGLQEDTDTNSCRNYILYEFGLSTTVSVTIIDGGTICDVVISDDLDHCFFKQCVKTDILKWAFEEMAVELCNAKYVIREEYQPAYYRLSLYHDGNEKFFILSSKQVDGNDDLNEKLDALKTFIVEIWNTTL